MQDQRQARVAVDDAGGRGTALRARRRGRGVGGAGTAVGEARDAGHGSSRTPRAGLRPAEGCLQRSEEAKGGDRARLGVADSAVRVASTGRVGRRVRRGADDVAATLGGGTR